jgi:6-phosphogluconate dehydrogenase
VDVGTSGGVWGLERGYCQMIGGEAGDRPHLDPIFKTLAPGRGNADRTPGREKAGGTAEEGYLYCGPSGAGHFVKMVHNGIEYGLMAAYAEGLEHSEARQRGEADRDADAETTPMRNPENYQYDLNLADIAEVWRRGSVVASWLLDLTAIALFKQPSLQPSPAAFPIPAKAAGPLWRPSTSPAPAPVLSAALYQRFSSRGEEDFRR